LHLDIQQKKIRPKISPTRINHDVANLPSVIQIVRPKNPKSAPMVLVDGNRALMTLGDPKLKLAHRRRRH
jgi:hypothetical protein